MMIALVSDYSLDYLGGAQTALLEEARALLAAGNGVVLIAPAGTMMLDEALVVEWIRAPFTLAGVDLPLIRNSKALRSRITRILTPHGVDVVHLHSEFGLAAACIDVARSLGVPVVHTVHTFFWRTGLPSPIGTLAASAIRLFGRWITGERMPEAPMSCTEADRALRSVTLATASRADVVISPSAHQSLALSSAGVDRVVVLPNTVTRDAGRRAPVLTRVAGPLRVVWIGRLSPEKRVREFVSAVRLALDRLPSGSLVVDIVGDGTDGSAARHLAGGHPAITFSGRLTPAAVMDRLAWCHVSALTSLGFDNQPMTVVESLFSSRGVLFVDPALSEGLDSAGVLCDSASVEGMADALVALAANPDAVMALSRRAHLAFEQFQPSAHVSGLTEVYREARMRAIGSVQPTSPGSTVTA